MIDGLRREASVRAVSFCSMFSFSKESLSQLLEMYPGVMRTMKAQMEARLRKWRLRRAINTVQTQNRVLKALGGSQQPRGVAGATSHGGADAPPSSADEAANAGSAPGTAAVPPVAGGCLGVLQRRCSMTSTRSESRRARSSAEGPGSSPTKVRQVSRLAEDLSKTMGKALSLTESGRSSPSSSRRSFDGGAGTSTSTAAVLPKDSINNSNSIEETLEKLTRGSSSQQGSNRSSRASELSSAPAPVDEPDGIRPFAEGKELGSPHTHEPVEGALSDGLEGGRMSRVEPGAGVLQEG